MIDPIPLLVLAGMGLLRLDLRDRRRGYTRLGRLELGLDSDATTIDWMADQLEPFNREGSQFGFQ
jgi:hypothetical protein